MQMFVEIYFLALVLIDSVKNEIKTEFLNRKSLRITNDIQYILKDFVKHIRSKNILKLILVI